MSLLVGAAVDKYIDFVHWVPTTKIPEVGADGKPEIVDGQVKMKVVWGGICRWKTRWPNGYLSGDNFISGPNPVLKGVIAVGGGPIALEEVKYANEHGVPLNISGRGSLSRSEWPIRFRR